MLNGLDPIILFHLFKATPSQLQSLSNIPLASDIVSAIGLPPIPIYLSERLTGLYIDSEDKNIDIETTTSTLADASAPEVNQRGINSTIRIDLIANKDSIGVTLLSAMSDLVFQRASSQEYSVTYLNGAITIFGGLIRSFSINQNADTDLYNISIEISKGRSSIGTLLGGQPSVSGVSGIALGA